MTPLLQALLLACHKYREQSTPFLCKVKKEKSWLAKPYSFFLFLNPFSSEFLKVILCINIVCTHQTKHK